MAMLVKTILHPLGIIDARYATYNCRSLDVYAQ